MTLESQEIQFLRKVIFAIPSMPNPCFCKPEHPNSDPKTNRKSNLKIDMKKTVSFVQKYQKTLSEWVPKINKKSIKSKPGPHRALLCAPQCPRIVPGSSQDRPRDLQDAKVEAPSMPNDTHGHHKPEIWSQKCRESGNQEPASQHTFQQRNSKNEKQTTKTYQTSKPSNRSEPKVLKQSCKYKKTTWKLTSRNQ